MSSSIISKTINSPNNCTALSFLFISQLWHDSCPDYDILSSLTIYCYSQPTCMFFGVIQEIRTRKYIGQTRGPQWEWEVLTGWVVSRQMLSNTCSKIILLRLSYGNHYPRQGRRVDMKCCMNTPRSFYQV